MQTFISGLMKSSVQSNTPAFPRPRARQPLEQASGLDHSGARWHGPSPHPPAAIELASGDRPTAYVEAPSARCQIMGSIGTQ